MRKIDRFIEPIVKQTERSILQTYARRLRGVQSSLARVFAKYEQDGKLTYDEMAKYNRLQSMEKEILDEVRQLHRDGGRQIRSAMREVYRESYYRTGWALETSTRAKLGYSYVKPDVVNAVLQNPMTGLTLNERLSRNRAQTLIRIKEQLTRGLIEGESYRKMSSRIKDVVEKDTYSAMRIVRTESTRAYNTGMFDSVEHASERGLVMVKRWISSGDDDRTRDSHLDLDGQEVPIGEEFKIHGHSALYPGDFGVAEEDINCRCTVAYEVVSIDKPEDDSLSGMKYDDWKRNRLY